MENQCYSVVRMVMGVRDLRNLVGILSCLYALLKRVVILCQAHLKLSSRKANVPIASIASLALPVLILRKLISIMT